MAEIGAKQWGLFERLCQKVRTCKRESKIALLEFFGRGAISFEKFMRL